MSFNRTKAQLNKARLSPLTMTGFKTLHQKLIDDVIKNKSMQSVVITCCHKNKVVNGLKTLTVIDLLLTQQTA